MRLDRRFVIVLSASLLWAFVVSALFYRMASGSGGGVHRTDSSKPVVVATRPLATGATVARDEVTLRDMPENFFPTGGFSRLDDVIDRPVINPIEAGEPLVEARLAVKGSGMGLAPLIPNGMRALAVRVNDVVGVAGFILPGMRVDVLVTGHQLNADDTVTRTVLQNVFVLSAGQTFQTDGKSQSINVPVVTLLVSPQDAEKLTLANSEGKVQLVLRNSGDDKVEPTAGSRLHDLLGAVAATETSPRGTPRRAAPEIVMRDPAANPTVGRQAAPGFVSLAIPPVPFAPPKPIEDEIEVIHGKTKTVELFPQGEGVQMIATERHTTEESDWEQRLLRHAANPGAFKLEYQELKFTLHRKLLERINLDALAGIDNDRIRSEVREAVLSMVQEEPTLLTAAEKQQISDEVLHEVFGLGPLEPLLADPAVSDILVNGYRQVYVERKGILEQTNVRFHDDGHLLRIIDKIVSQVGRRVDESNPMVDARLSDGSRVNAIIPPLAVDGPLLSIRRFGTDRLMPEDLVAKGSLTRGMMMVLEAAVRAKLNLIVSGGTGAGKTTLLNALSAFISPKERIITIEDAAELQLKQPHLARLETRPANLEGHGAVRQRQLLINSLRMRPDRIIVGEVRGEEALDMLQAMNTGHDGSLTTVHANTPRDAISRLEVMVTLANANMHLTAIRQQIASAVHLLVQCSRLSDGTRRITHITEVTGIETDIVTLQDIFAFEKRGLSPSGRVIGRFCATGILPKFNEKLVMAGVRLPLDVFDEMLEVEDPQW